jgi:hypothetical protein
MPGHRHAHGAVSRSDFASEHEWAEWVRDYYRDVETYDWVDVADNWRGLETIFHRNRRRGHEEVAGMLRDRDHVRVWHSALRFNVLFAAERPGQTPLLESRGGSPAHHAPK